MTQSPRQELLAIQKKLWKWNRDMIKRSVLVKEPGFDRYEAAYRNAVKDFKRVSSQDEMIDDVMKSDIIYVGDYHTCNQSQRSFLRILKATVKRTKKFAVGLELLHKRHQKVLDDYLSGREKEEGFLKKIKLKEHWVFDLWENFKPLFDFCRYHKIPIYAIDAAKDGSNVRKRDQATAKLIGEIISSDPDRRLFVFIGDLHIAPKHLPADVDRELSIRDLARNSLILYQNSESIYWDLARQEVEDYVEIVKLKDGNYCRMHTPPVVAQRSYLNWLEHEEGEIDYSDAKSSFIELVDRICDFLKLDVGAAKDEVEVFTSGDLTFLQRLKEKGDFSGKEIAMIKKQILASESYYISKAKIAYLANLSINHAAEEASHFIKNVCSGPESPRELIDAFYANVLHEALGFFGSKLINSRRKCYHEKDFASLLSYFKTIRVPPYRLLECETAHLVIEYLKLEKKGRHLTQAEGLCSRMDLFLSITHALGYMLGDRLYYALIAQQIKKKDVRKLFLDPWRGSGVPVDVYMALRKKLAAVKIPNRM
ncbi:MAG: ChaN family lipoprotein [Myxococcales bacterium]|nr:ChaN family lipoprotein [Myxococcales bacterium]